MEKYRTKFPTEILFTLSPGIHRLISVLWPWIHNCINNTLRGLIRICVHSPLTPKVNAHSWSGIRLKVDTLGPAGVAIHVCSAQSQMRLDSPNITTHNRFVVFPISCKVFFRRWYNIQWAAGFRVIEDYETLSLRTVEQWIDNQGKERLGRMATINLK